MEIARKREISMVDCWGECIDFGHFTTLQHEYEYKYVLSSWVELTIIYFRLAVPKSGRLLILFKVCG